MAKKSIFKEIAKFLESEKNKNDETKIVVKEDGVTIYPGKNGIIYGYMLRAIYMVAGVHNLDYYVCSKIDGTTYLNIY